MSFDLSRVRFDPRKDFLGVIMQQGRVQLDSDWNEWIAQVARRIHVGTLDALGHAVVPNETPEGFKIEAKDGELTIGPGRMYVDGLLAENHGTAPKAWKGHLAEDTGTGPTPFYDQPYLKFNETSARRLPLNLLNKPKLEGGKYLIYLDVWQRDVTHLQEPGLVEQAVGVDSTGRVQTVWQAKLLKCAENTTCATADVEIPGWEDVTRPSMGRLSTSTGEPPVEPEPCRIAPTAGYRGDENQLYRVEIHRTGAHGKATFKWSRDNATVATRVTHINGTLLKVESVGRDDVLRFHDGDWVEITDDWYEFHNLPGQMARILVGEGVDLNANVINLDTDVASAFPVAEGGATLRDRHTRVRRWDQSRSVLKEDGSVYHNLDDANLSDPDTRGTIPVPPPGTKVFLENGILVEFAQEVVDRTGAFKSGDYWSFAARTAEASVEMLDHAPPRGIHHHFARLALVTFPLTKVSEPDDCRVPWPKETRGLCTEVVAPGESIAQAVRRLSPIGGTVCLLPGIHQAEHVQVEDVPYPVVLRGAGAATSIRASKAATALRFLRCGDLTLVDLSVESSGAATAALAGALAFHDCGSVRLRSCTVKCSPPGGTERKHQRTCITFARSAPSDQEATGSTVKKRRAKVKGSAATDAAKSATPLLNFELHDCVLVADSADSIGLLVDGSLAATVRDAWVVRSLKTERIRAIELLDTAIVVRNCIQASIVGATTANFYVAMWVQGCVDLRLSGTRTMWPSEEWGDIGLVLLNVTAAQLTDNVIDTRNAAILALGGEIMLHGNRWRVAVTENVPAFDMPATTLPELKDLIDADYWGLGVIAAASIVASGNMWHAGGARPLTSSLQIVGLDGGRVLFHGNTSVCERLIGGRGGRASVELSAPGGNVTATGNTCFVGGGPGVMALRCAGGATATAGNIVKGGGLDVQGEPTTDVGNVKAL
jgi:hypothetical protein